MPNSPKNADETNEFLQEGQKHMITEAEYKQAAATVNQWRREQLEEWLTTMPIGAKFYLKRDVDIRSIPNGNHIAAVITKRENGRFDILTPSAIDTMTMTYETLFNRLYRPIEEEHGNTHVPLQAK